MEIPKTDDLSLLTNPASTAFEEARGFVLGHRWVRSFRSVYVALDIESVLSIFLFCLDDRDQGVDPYLWVLVGDIPPAYISAAVAADAVEALDAYVGAMQEWVRAVREGRDVNGLIPVNTVASRQAADSLETRLNFIDKYIFKELRQRLSGRNASNHN
jgi:hypothetical protein